jgi:hypothetical protein
MLLATAERRLSGEYEKARAALVADKDENFTLRTDASTPVAILCAATTWRGSGRARTCFRPACNLDRRQNGFRRAQGGGDQRLKLWSAIRSKAILAICASPESPRRCVAPPAIRSILAMLVDEGGILRASR